MKRIALLCVLATALTAMMMLPACATPELYKVSVSNPAGDPIPKAPAFINYTLNCTADMTFEIYPSTSAGVISGAKIRTETITGIAKGPRLYMWPCTQDSGAAASAGYYVCVLTAKASPATFSRIIGTFKANENKTEYPEAWDPSVTDVWGYYGASINTNPNSAYYGRVYAANVNYQEIYMWDCDGTYLGTMDDSGISWGPSAPWDAYVARDGYVYVSDRSNQRVYVFAPDGSKVGTTDPLVPTSNGPGTYYRGMMVRQTVDDVTHIFHSSGAAISHSTCSADHLTWSARATACDPPDETWGVWASSDCGYLYVVQSGGTVERYNKGLDWTYTADATWGCPETAASDACESADGTFLWISRFELGTPNPIAKFWKEAGNTVNPTWAVSTVYTKGQVVVPTVANAHKYVCIVAGTSNGTTEPTWPLTAYATVTDGTVTWQEASTIYYSDGTVPPVVQSLRFPKGVQSDSVGNVLITYGKSANSWPSYYWALATEAGTDLQAQRQSTVFEVTSDPAPVVVPGSATWSFSDVSGKLRPNNLATATVNFKALDANGYADIAGVKVTLTSVKLASDAPVVQDVDSMVADTTDLNGLTVLCSKTFTAVVGAKAGLHTDIRIEPRDVSPTVAATYENYTVDVLGATLTGTVKHIRHSALIAGATMTIIGGTTGVYGYPFTYTTGLTNAFGIASVGISEGSFTVIAEKVGYKKAAPAGFIVSSVNLGTTIYRDVDIGPVTIAEAKALPGGTVGSVEGVCYAQPKGLAPTFAYGLDYRLHSVSGTIATLYNQWYMCDPGAGDPGGATNGMQFMLKPTADPVFPFTWDDPLKVDDFGTPMYIGRRPRDSDGLGDYTKGDTICVTGEINYITTYEKRCVVRDADFSGESAFGTYNQTYLNRNFVVGNTVPSPVSRTIAQIYHGNAPSAPPASWGTLASVAGARVVKWDSVGGAIPAGAYTPAAGEASIPCAIVMNSALDWCTITPQTLTSLGLAPVDVGDVYTFTGAGGRRARTGEGTLRVRKTADMFKTTDNTPPAADNIGSIRGAPASGLNLQGIVTAKFTDYIYVESADRSSGARVNASAAAQWFVSVGDSVWFTGDTALLEGQKVVSPTSPFVVLSSGNPLPYLGIRNRDMGGFQYGVNDPGVTNGLGALNVGLLVKVHGIVTYRDTAGTPAYFYIWDGGNRTSAPVNDGNANGAWGVRINHSGWIGTAGVVPWTDWVEIDGLVSVNTTAVSLSTIAEIIPRITPVRLVPADFTATPFPFTAGPPPAGTILAGKNLIGVPHTPGDVGNGDSTGFGQAYDPVTVLSPDKLNPDWYVRAEPIDGKLLRWDSGTASSKGFDMWAEPHGEFGGIILGDGYWVTAGTAWTTSTYKARVQNIPQWISPGAAAKILIANPQNHDVALDPVNRSPAEDWRTGVMMSDGGQVKSFYNASTYGVGWIQSIGLWWDNAAGSSRDTGVVEDWAFDDKLLAWHGYWFTWLQNYKSMIVP